MGGVIFFAAEPLSRMMGADDILLDTTVRYLRTVALCSPLATIFFAMDNYLRISGFVKTSMMINIGCNILTIGLLVFFLLGCRMDVVGSALATSIAMCASSVVAMIPFIRNKALLKFVKPKFNSAMVKKIVVCGSPSFLSNISGRVTSILMNISLMTLGAKVLGEGGGTTTVAVYAILMYASDMCWPLLYGLPFSCHRLQLGCRGLQPCEEDRRNRLCFNCFGWPYFYIDPVLLPRNHCGTVCQCGRCSTVGSIHACNPDFLLCLCVPLVGCYDPEFLKRSTKTCTGNDHVSGHCASIPCYSVGRIMAL
jgi:hypothetical protein